MTRYRYVAFSVCTLGADEHRVSIVVAHREGQQIVFDTKERDVSGEEASRIAQRFGISYVMAELYEGGDSLVQAERGARWLAEKAAA